MEEIYSVFTQEAREQLTAMEDGLLRMEQGDSDADVLNAIFRAAHTIKGASGVVELHHIERFTHILETLLDRVRNTEITVNSDMITLLLRGCDHIRSLLDVVEQGSLEPDPQHSEAGQVLAQGLRAFGNGAAHPTQGESAPSPSACTGVNQAPASPSQGPCSHADSWHISIRFGLNVLKMGMDPLNFLRYLQTLGEITHLSTLSESLPPAQDMDPECCYLGFEVDLHSSASKEEIENVFAFCRDDCELHILPPRSKVADYLDLIESLPEEPMRLGEILVCAGALTQEELEDGLRRQRAVDTRQPSAADAHTRTAQAPIPVLGEILVEHKMVQPEIVEAAAARQKQVQDKRNNEARLIRVHADKLDQLIDLVGELVIAGASASLLARRSAQTPLMEATSVVSRLVENIRDSALQLRMVPIGETFHRFNRVVRDTARELGKDIELVISGGETELDKSVVEKIGDPLMHLMRNAMDHGIELPAQRLSHGKPACGRVQLNAFHDSGSVVIEVIDDGAGIPTERVQTKAIERGIIQAGHNLSEQEIVNLIFEAGLSTAQTVSNLSGRGVGMDVVKRNIQALRGSVEVKTWPGEGSHFTIRLPLTLAIIDGFLTSVGTAFYVIPLDSVVECLELKKDDTCGHMLNLRGEVLPFIRLREFFGVGGQAPLRENVVVITMGRQKAGIVVDQLLGEFQTVIKPLGQLFRHLRGIGGSTILGSGDVALILDVQALTKLAASQNEQSSLPSTHRTHALTMASTH